MGFVKKTRKLTFFKLKYQRRENTFFNYGSMCLFLGQYRKVWEGNKIVK